MTSPPSHVDLVVLAAFLCGADKSAIDTEDIAVKAHELAPSRFSWRKFPNQINLELVRVSLSDAKKSEKGELLAGSGRTGWTLTSNGLRWVEQEKNGLLKADMERDRADGRGGSIDEEHWRRERERILSTKAWTVWSTGDTTISARDAAEVFRIDNYAIGRMRTLKITRLKSLFSGDKSILPFLNHVEGILIKSEPRNADANA